MIQRVSELDQYYLSNFNADYIDMQETIRTDDGTDIDNPHYGRFKKQSFKDNLSSTMLFEASIGRPLNPDDGSLQDDAPENNEAVSYYKSFKMGADVFGAIAYAIVNEYFITEDISFGEPGLPGEGCLDHKRYPDHNSDKSLEVYLRAYFHSPTTFHHVVNFHDNIYAHKDLATSMTSHINFPGLQNYYNGDPQSWSFNKDIDGTCMRARWADLAECYKSDADYPPGTLVQFGGEEEITMAKTEANAVITDNPGFVLNSTNKDKMLGIALTGRTPVRVVGPVKKFDKLCFSGTPGLACKKVSDEPTIAVALEDSDSPGEKLVLCSVQLRL